MFIQLMDIKKQTVILNLNDISVVRIINNQVHIFMTGDSNGGHIFDVSVFPALKQKMGLP